MLKEPRRPRTEKAATTLRLKFGRFCSYQDNLGASEYRHDRRVHGLQLPLHPLQIVGWIAIVIFVISTFYVLIPALNPTFHVPLSCLFVVLYVVHLVAHAIALLLDPADPELRRLHGSSRSSVPEFDRTKHSHVIENGRCHLCNIKTTSHRTKHCSVCNKVFLRHCMSSKKYSVDTRL
jgi:palmitoyltransferase